MFWIVSIVDLVYTESAFCQMCYFSVNIVKMLYIYILSLLIWQKSFLIRLDHIIDRLNNLATCTVVYMHMCVVKDAGKWQYCFCLSVMLYIIESIPIVYGCNGTSQYLDTLLLTKVVHPKIVGEIYIFYNSFVLFKKMGKYFLSIQKFWRPSKEGLNFASDIC